MARVYIIIWLAALLPATGCGKPNPADRYQRPEQITDFAKLYNTNCRGCHGPDGKMGPAPPLNDPLFLAIVPDSELREVIRHGRKGTLMPDFAGRQSDSFARLEKSPIIGSGMLTDKQIDLVIKGMRDSWGGPVQRSLPRYLGAKAVKEELAKGDVESGKTVFANACAYCHGDDGRGLKKVGAVNAPVFLSLVSDQLLRRIVITGRPDLGMPNYHKTVEGKTLAETEANIRDVTALLASWRTASSTGEKRGSKQ